MIDDADGKEAEELEERLKEKEAKTQAILLEMVCRRNVLSSLNGTYQECSMSTLFCHTVP